LPNALGSEKVDVDPLRQKRLSEFNLMRGKLLNGQIKKNGGPEQ
jgi:hypothetical protein